jgi:hypothetical protein
VFERLMPREKFLNRVPMLLQMMEPLKLEKLFV